MVPVPHEEFKMLDLPFGEFPQEDTHLIQEDLKKLLSSEKFLEIKNLDLSPFSIETEIIEMLIQSDYIKNLQILDISNSKIKNEDLELIGKDVKN